MDLSSVRMDQTWRKPIAVKLPVGCTILAALVQTLDGPHAKKVGQYRA